MNDDLTAFGAEQAEGKGGFEDFGHDNGGHFWWRSDLQPLLGYADATSFEKPVGKAMAACAALSISVHENFTPAMRAFPDGRELEDCKLSRFACYMIAMNASPRKPQVAHAQAYFATLAEFARQMLVQGGEVERVVMRDELTDRENSLSRVARAADVQEYALFQNAGYRGLYNMNMNRLKKEKGIPEGRTLLDFMGREELAANLFRITQTEAKIKKENVRGQRDLENTAESVGKEIRQTIRKIGGTMPEQLPVSEDIKKVKSGLKKTHRDLQKIDKKRLPKPKKEK